VIPEPVAVASALAVAALIARGLVRWLWRIPSRLRTALSPGG